MIEPAIDALVTSCSPSLSANRAMMSSGALPNVTFSRPPTPGPARPAASSVARPIAAAAGTSARAAVKKTTVSDAFAASSAIAAGMKTARRYCGRNAS